MRAYIKRKEVEKAFSVVAMTCGGLVGWVIGKFEPAFPLIIIATLFVLYDSWSAYELDKRVQNLQEKLAESNRLRQAAEQEWKLREAELLVKLAAADARIAELEKLIPGIDSRQVADAMDEKFGV